MICSNLVTTHASISRLWREVMRMYQRFVWLLLATLVELSPATVGAQGVNDDETPAPRASRRPTPRDVISSHQIDRFEAIRQLRQALKANPNDEWDWIILGELAHEVALDLPSDQDDEYYRLSRDAYERALRLDPDNAGLRAAVRFARDQEDNSAQFDRDRQRAVRTYLQARRRETAASGFSPTIQVYTTDTTTDPSPDEDPAAAPRSRSQSGRGNSPRPVYQPYSPSQPSQGAPVTYRQYADSYAPPSDDTPAATQPTTLRGFAAELPGVLLNEAKRGGRGGTPAPRPR